MFRSSESRWKTWRSTGEEQSLATLWDGDQSPPRILQSHAADPPRFEQLRAKASIEVDRRRVPVEDRPLQPGTPALLRERDEALEEALAYAAPAVLRQDEQILEPDPAASSPGRVRMKEEGEPHGVSSHLREPALERRIDGH